jgi:hexosaminidase
MRKPLYYLLFLVLFFGCEPTPPVEQPVLDLVPQVKSLQQQQGSLDFRKVALIQGEVLEIFNDYLRSSLSDRAIDILQPEKNITTIEFHRLDFGAESSYELKINKEGVNIKAAHSSGFFYGIQTLLQIIDANRSELQLPFVDIEDEALFQHRGVLLDCCRHFMSVKKVKKVIDLMAYHKMNVLHWHLTEDQGWRIEIDAYPKLTEVGAWRTEQDGSIHGGYYTKEDIREIVSYASVRQVEIIPEIEMPGHSTAAIAAYPWLSCSGEPTEVVNEWGVFQNIYCAGNDTTFAFLKTVLDEVCELFPSSYIHIGGDEAPKTNWKNCTRCKNRIRTAGLANEHELQSYFIQRVSQYLGEKGKKIIGWDEILEGGLPDGAIVQSWRGMDGGIKALEQGGAAIMSPTSHAYFDYPITTTDLEKVYEFDPLPEGLSKDRRSFVLGGECNLWTEHIPEDRLEIMMFPRVCAMAEVLWTKRSGKDYADFKQRMKQHYKRLDLLDVNYGFPEWPISIETVIQDERLFAEVVPNLEDGSLQIYSGDELIGQDLSDTFRFEVLGEMMLDFRLKQGDRTFEDQLNDHLYRHLGVFSAPLESSEYSPYYTGGGDRALLDGLLGSHDFRDGRWQAVQGDDLFIVLDLKEEQEVKSVASNYLFYNNAWIFLPDSVSFEVSTDGENWESLSPPLVFDFDQRIKNKVEVLRVKHDFEPRIARFLRMRAYNRGETPVWHDAPGEPAWLFCDEFIVE